MNPPMPTLLPVWTNILVEKLIDWAGAPGVAVGVAGGAVGVAVVGGVTVAVGPGVPVGPGVAVPTGVAVGVAVPPGVGVGVATQAPFTLNTMCMFGNPIAVVVVGVLIEQLVALI
jgi:hypothetical protein